MPLTFIIYNVTALQMSCKPLSGVYLVELQVHLGVFLEDSVVFFSRSCTILLPSLWLILTHLQYLFCIISLSKCGHVRCLLVSRGQWRRTMWPTMKLLRDEREASYVLRSAWFRWIGSRDLGHLGRGTLCIKLHYVSLIIYRGQW